MRAGPALLSLPQILHSSNTHFSHTHTHTHSIELVLVFWSLTMETIIIISVGKFGLISFIISFPRSFLHLQRKLLQPAGRKYQTWHVFKHSQLHPDSSLLNLTYLRWRLLVVSHEQTLKGLFWLCRHRETFQHELMQSCFISWSYWNSSDCWDKPHPTTGWTQVVLLISLNQKKKANGDKLPVSGNHSETIKRFNTQKYVGARGKATGSERSQQWFKIWVKIALNCFL